jgi:hypothetical protein
MDYPLYEESCRRKHPAAKWWLIGDWLYYLGLLPAVMSFVAVPFLAVCSLLHQINWRMFWLAVGTFPVAVVVFFVGVSLKGYAHRVAEREGIKWY